jgi:hypothetical protein
MVEAVFRRVSSFLEQGKVPVIIGGEHSVSIGSIQAFADPIIRIFRCFSLMPIPICGMNMKAQGIITHV